MKEFSKKSSIFILVISYIFLAVGIILITNSRSILPFLQKLFLQIFNRSYSYEKIAASVNGFICIPIFIATFVDGILFIKFSKKFKNILLVSYFAVSSFLIIFTCVNITSRHTNSDMASELVLAKKCADYNTPFPKDWNYSTELRVLNTQLISGVLFKFTNNWSVVKVLTVIISCILLFFAVLFFFMQFKIKDKIIMLICCYLLIIPCSECSWDIMFWGNYYIPHIIAMFLYLGLFYKLCFQSVSKKKNIVILTLFCILAFISGVSGIRYVVLFIFPLFAASFIYEIVPYFKSEIKFNAKSFFFENKKIFYSLLGMIICASGYIFNSLILQQLFSYSNWNKEAFTPLEDISISKSVKAILEVLGFQGDVAVLSATGFTNILLLIGLFMLIPTFIKLFNKTKIIENQSEKLDKINFVEEHKFFLYFSVVVWVFNIFLFTFVDFTTRYFLLITELLVPCLAIIITNTSVPKITKFLLGTIFSIVFISNSYISLQKDFTADNCKDKHDICNYLEKSNYTFGYGTFWNANVFTEMTNGKIEVGNLKHGTKDGVNILPTEYIIDKWLTPEHYYNDDYKANEHVFLIVSTEQYEASKDDNVIKNGVLVYQDDYYRLFDYNNKAAFKTAFSDF